MIFLRRVLGRGRTGRAWRTSVSLTALLVSGSASSRALVAALYLDEPGVVLSGTATTVNRTSSTGAIAQGMALVGTATTVNRTSSTGAIAQGSGTLSTRVVRSESVRRSVRSSYGQRIVRTTSITRRVSTMGTAKSVEPVDVGEGAWFEFDFSTDLATETGTSVIVQNSIAFEVDVRAGIHQDAQSIVSGAPAVKPGGTVVRQLVRGVLPGVGYALRCKAAGPDGVPHVAVALFRGARL